MKFRNNKILESELPLNKKMVELKKFYNVSDENFKRDQRILEQINLKKLPFKISVDSFSAKYLDMFLDMKPLFKYKVGEYAMKWCLSTEKK